MPLRHLLEDFGSLAEPGAVSGADAEELRETDRLDSFEKGYKAGWDDAIKAQSEIRTNLSGDLAQNLQDLSFTYHEVWRDVAGSLAPLLDQIVTRVLPEMAHQTLGPIIVEQLASMLGGRADPSAEIAVAPDKVEAVETLIEGEVAVPVTVRGDPALAEGQVHLRVGTAERQIDLEDVQRRISEAVAGFFHENRTA